MWQRIKNIYHLGNAILANVWFGFPSKHLTVIGVTGTDGKTTTVSLIYHILYKAGYNASMISSVGAVIGGKEYDVGFHVTTPSSWALQRFIRKALGSPRSVARGSSEAKMLRSLRQFGDSSSSNVNQGFSLARAKSSETGSEDALFKSPPHAKAPRIFNYLVLEVTSHAIDQNRIWGIPFDIGVLTNVTHEHLDYHKTYENYVKTKTKLLRMSRVAVVNRDDNSFALVKSEIRNPKSETIPLTLTLSLEGRGKRERVNQRFITYGMKESSNITPHVFPFKTNLIGEFNRYNVLAGIAVCRELGVDDKTIRDAITSFKPPVGREEIVYPSTLRQAQGSGQANFTVMVDFAHTPNAFEEILSSVKPSIKGRLIHVFGSAGERDASKRPLMGKASSKYADVIVLTAEDPRSESVDKIINEIELGITNSKFEIRNSKQFSKLEFSNIQNKKKYVLEIPNRQEAITLAIKMARRGDFVLITGKGHEKSMNYGRGEEPWDEYKAVRKALRSVIASDSEAISNGIATSSRLVGTPRNDN